MAGRILGMGDIVSLVEDVKNAVDVQKAQKFAEKIKKAMPSTWKISKNKSHRLKISEASVLLSKASGLNSPRCRFRLMMRKLIRWFRTEGIINSMTPKERRKAWKSSRPAEREELPQVPVLVCRKSTSCCKTILEQSRDMMKMMKKGGMAKMMRAFKSFGGRFQVWEASKLLETQALKNSGD